MCRDARGSGAFCDIASCVSCFVGGTNALKQRSGSANKASGHAKLSVKPGCKASGGEIRSENVDMSSDKQGEKPCRRKSKGSCLKLI
jgi:hypothetical protein